MYRLTQESKNVHIIIYKYLEFNGSVYFGLLGQAWLTLSGLSGTSLSSCLVTGKSHLGGPNWDDHTPYGHSFSSRPSGFQMKSREPCKSANRRKQGLQGHPCTILSSTPDSQGEKTEPAMEWSNYSYWEGHGDQRPLVMAINAINLPSPALWLQLFTFSRVKIHS